MEILQIRNLSFKYALSEKNALTDINLTVHEGDFIVVCGESASGKSTLLKLLKNEIAPAGEKIGQILFEGNEISLMSNEESAKNIGFVSQNTEAQIVTEHVFSELAFGLENLMVPSQIIRQKTSEMAIYFGMEDIFEKSVLELSGGQKQILNLASVLIMNPKVLLLDEPTSKLDKIAAEEFLSTLKKVNEEFGITVIMVEHRLEEVFSMANRVIVMERGKIIVDDCKRNIYHSLTRINENHPMLYGLPAAVRIFGKDARNHCPICVKEGISYLLNHFDIPKQESKQCNTVINKTDKKKYVITAKNLWFRYDKKEKDILRGVQFSLEYQTLHCLLGGNGCGKSTLISIIAGINRPYKGNVKKEKCLVLPQNPLDLFVKDRIYDDFLDIGKTYGKNESEVVKIIARYEPVLHIEKIKEKHPYDLSGGEIQKAALMKLLIGDSKVLLLDEPTKGLDAFLKRSFAKIIENLKKDGYSFLMVTHDVEFAAQYANCCSMLFGGEIITTADTNQFFSNNYYFTTAASRIMRKVNSEIITSKQAIEWIQHLNKKGSNKENVNERKKAD